jgi:hypothetical protein
MRRAVVLVMLAGCGRLGFDARTDVTGDGPLAGDAAGQSDGPGSGIGSGSGGLVQGSPVMTGAGSVVVMLPSPTLGGTLLVATIGANVLTSFATPSGWQTNVTGMTNGACNSVIATEPNAPAGQTSLTFSVAAGVPVTVQVTEWQGTTGFDSGGFVGGTTPVTALSVATMLPDSTAGDLAIATFCEDTNMPVFLAGAGWAQLGQLQTTSSAPSLLAEYATNQPATTVTATASTTASAKYAATIITLHP